MNIAREKNAKNCQSTFEVDFQDSQNVLYDKLFQIALLFFFEEALVLLQSVGNANHGGFQLEFVNRVINDMTCYKSSALIG